jgi:hypothetical protein
MSLNVENPVRGASDGSIASCRSHVVATTAREEAERKKVRGMSLGPARCLFRRPMNPNANILARARLMTKGPGSLHLPHLSPWGAKEA